MSDSEASATDTTYVLGKRPLSPSLLSEDERRDGAMNSDSGSLHATVALPKGVYWDKKVGKYFVQFSRSGKKYRGPYSLDLSYLHQWRLAKDAELDAAGVPETQVRKKREPATRQSETPGVNWNEKRQKWEGKCVDRLRSAEGAPRHRHTPRFADEAACISALAALRAQELKDFELEMAKRKAADPRLAGLDRAPAACDAQRGTVYWNVDGQTKYVPYRAVVGGKWYRRACTECAQVAQSTPGGAETHCIQHGGGQRCLGPGDGVECPYGVAVQLGKRDIYDGHCVSCFCSAFPNDPRTTAARSSIHAKERVVTAVLKERFPNYNWTFDKSFVHRPMVVGVRTRCRPDARFAHADRVIIVEIDENSHRTYLCTKEREREASFVAQNRGKAVVMIRFNPDAYTDYSGKRIPSCFTSANKDKEIVHVHPKQRGQWDRRLDELERTIATLADPEFELPPKQDDRHLLICELFYDNVLATAEDKRVAAGLARGKAMGRKRKQI